LQAAYDVSFKLIVIRYAEGTGNSKKSRKYSISQADILWWKDKGQLLGVPKVGHCKEVEEKFVKKNCI
jgi:hypothetical protein